MKHLPSLLPSTVPAPLPSGIIPSSEPVTIPTAPLIYSNTLPLQLIPPPNAVNTTLFNKLRWIKLKDIPGIIANAYPAKLNDHSFLVASGYIKYHQMISIQKYDARTDEWSKYILDKRQKWDISSQCITTDLETNIIYLSASNYPLIIINTKTTQCDIAKIDKQRFKHLGAAKLLNINDRIHLITDCDAKHLIWDTHNMCLDLIYDFKMELYGHSLVFVTKKQMIFLIGGHCFYEGMLQNMGIWRYSLLTNEWKQIKDIEFKYREVSAVVTSDEEYIIISGGCIEHDQYVDIIHILDIRDNDDDDKYILHECSIKCPLNYPHHIVYIEREQDKILLIGWIKCVFSFISCKDIRLPSMDIIQLIALYYSQQEIHWIQNSNYNAWEYEDECNEHFVINVQDILSSIL